ncbi:MAG TPA: GAF domain-containing sensor histidine kinase [Anaerolineae bacterium]
MSQTNPALQEVLETLNHATRAGAAPGELKGALRQIADLAHTLELRNRQLAALNDAAGAIASELALDKVLQQIVDSVRELAGAEYAALGVPGQDGYLETFVHSGMPAEQVVQIPHLPKGLGLLGAIIRERKVIRIPRISDDPRSAGFPEGHPPMEAFLGVPVMAGDEMLGNLYLTNKIGADEFTAADEELVELLAVHAAIAIQNARLYEQVGRLAIVEERSRIGMDLHDGVIQSIYAVGLTLESTRLALPAAAAEADQLLGHAIEALNHTIQDIRNFILDLRPHHFRGDLSEGLARLVREFQANTMVNTSLSAPAEVVSGLPTSVARAIFLTTQEALANIARHARASQVSIDVEREGLNVVLTLSDDGRGFNAAERDQTVGHGLANMQARAKELNGSFEIHSAPDQGTTVRLTLPYR